MNNGQDMMANASSTKLTDETKSILQEISGRFAFEDGAVNVIDKQSLKIITGFGPTNAPTAGTLSVMLGVLKLQQKLNKPLTIIVSELGAWNSRNLPWEVLEQTAIKMQSFMNALYGTNDSITIRTHLDPDNLIRAGKIARFLTYKDLSQYKESLNELYMQHGLLGSDIGMVVDTLYTVADILEPASEGYENILMVSGYEEGYFVDLSKIVLANQAKSKEITLNWQSDIGALFFSVIKGFSGYPKMSKSIPESAINFNQDIKEISHKLLSNGEVDQKTILACMEYASRWSNEQIEAAHVAYTNRDISVSDWDDVKHEYLNEFLSIKDLWIKA